MATKKAKRISVRIDAALADKLEDLIRYSKNDLSTLVTQALEQLCKANFKNAENPWEAWNNTGFIGCAKGPKDLSTNYKQYLNKDLAKKHSL